MRFSEYVDVYLAAVRGRLRSHRRVAANLRRWSDFFGERELESIRRADVARFVASRLSAGRSVNTVNCDLLILSGAFNYAIRVLEWDVSNPVSGQLLKAPEGRLRYLTLEESHRLLEASGRVFRKRYVRPFVVLALNTGCRKNELMRLKWSAVDLAAGRFTLDGENTKNGKRRVLPLNAAALEALRQCRRYCDENCPDSPWVFCWKDGAPIGDLRRGFRAACELAGIEDFRIHDLRHTFASWLVQREVPLMYVRDLLGHSSIKMTERYAHLAQDSLVRAVAVLDGL